MADPPLHSDTRDGTDAGPAPGSTTATPRWVKVFGIVAFVVVLLVVVMMLVGGGSGHGPGRHTSSSGVTRADTPQSGHR